MAEPIINQYQTWRCDEYEVLLGIRDGIVLFCRCDCPKVNRSSELLTDYPSENDVWSYETSYCVHSYTVLAHFYAKHAMSELETERID